MTEFRLKLVPTENETGKSQRKDVKETGNAGQFSADTVRGEFAA